MLDFRIIRVAIGRPFADAYSFLADGRNFSAWGGGDPGTAVEALGGNDWLVQIDGNMVVLRYSAPNQYGILDHQAYRQGQQPGRTTPVRLYANDEGAELAFTHFRPTDYSDEQFASGAEWLESDLMRLKTFMEKDRPPLAMLESRILSLSIERTVKDVYRFLAEPRNFPSWASLTGHRFEHRGGRDWLADTAAGERIVRFCEPNQFGVLDHALFAVGEAPTTNPMRVVANEEGTLLTYTCFQRPGTSDEKFASTVEWIMTDFLTLKAVLEF